MKRFTRVGGVAAAMPAANIDTDVIMPKQFLRGIDREGLARGLFHDLRFDAVGAPRPDFVLNRPGTADARFLVVGPNFGCGSSREHAVWGLLQYGIRAILGTTFAGIFADNAANNGLLLVSLEPAALAGLADEVVARRSRLVVDLEGERIELADRVVPFAVDPERRRALMLGLDPIAESLGRADAVRAFELSYFAQSPWLIEEGG